MNDDTHGPNHAGTGCPTCDPRGGQPPAVGPRLATVKFTARGEDFRIVQLQGQLLVCARQHGSCCCGWDEKGRMPFDPQALWGEEWERRKIRNRLHLTFTGCLGPCAVGNNALLVLHGRSIWLKDLNHQDLANAVYDWIDSMLAAGRILPPPAYRMRARVGSASVLKASTTPVTTSSCGTAPRAATTAAGSLATGIVRRPSSATISDQMVASRCGGNATCRRLR